MQLVIKSLIKVATETMAFKLFVHLVTSVIPDSDKTSAPLKVCHFKEDLYFILDASVGGLGKQKIAYIFRACLAEIACNMLISYHCYTYETDSDIGLTFCINAN